MVQTIASILLLLSAVASQAITFNLTWDASPTPGVLYRVWMASNAAPAIVIRTTMASSTVLSLNPGAYTFFVTAVGTTSESDPSNIFRLPPVASGVSGVSATSVTGAGNGGRARTFDLPPDGVYATSGKAVVPQ